MSARHGWSLLVLASALPALAEASPGALSSGARVRLTVPSVSEHRLIGNLVRRDEISFDIAHDNGSVSSVPLTNIAKLEVSAGMKRRSWLAPSAARPSASASRCLETARGKTAAY